MGQSDSPQVLLSKLKKYAKVLCKQILFSDDLADDLVQAALVVALEKQAVNPFSYAMGCIRLQALKFRDARRIRQSNELDFALDLAPSFVRSHHARPRPLVNSSRVLPKPKVQIACGVCAKVFVPREKTVKNCSKECGHVAKARAQAGKPQKRVGKN